MKVRNTVPYIILLLFVLIALLIRSKLLFFNLPVCANIDERQGLRLLFHFQNDSLNPLFFRYPTLYYYLTYFFIKIFGNILNSLFIGRLLNLFIGASTAIVIYHLSNNVFKSKQVGLLAALFTLFSPIIVGNCSYIITDPLLTLFSLLTLFYMLKFFQSNNRIRLLFLMMLFMGLAIATKYTAVLIIFVYLIMEFYKNLGPIKNTNDSIIIKIFNTKINPTIFSLFVLFFGIALLTLSIHFPENYIQLLISRGGNLNAELNQTDLDFILSTKNKLLFLGFLSIIFSIVIFSVKKIRDRFILLRPYLAIFIILIIFLACNPYIFKSWTIFLYDFGAEMKANQFAGKGIQFLDYIKFYIKKESILVFVFFIVGLFTAIKTKRSILILLLYLIIQYLIIGSATRGFPRYLTPLLPIIFSFSAYGIYSLSTYLGEKIKFGKLIIIPIIFFIFLENYHVVKPILNRRFHNDDMYESYQYVINRNPNIIYYSGYVPDVEFELYGLSTVQIAERDLNIKSLSEVMNFSDILIVDRARYNLLADNDLNSLFLEKSFDAEYGQFIFKYKK